MWKHTVIITVLCLFGIYGQNYRLPKDLYPLQYTLQLTTNIENFDETDESSFEFTGLVTIELLSDAEVKNITLHRSADLIPVAVTLYNSSDVEEKIIPILPSWNTSEAYNEETEQWVIELENSQWLEGTLKIEYTSTHSDDMYGFYKSYYLNENNEKRWLLATQFQSAFARRAFPCFDEPEFRAIYDLSIIVNKSLVDDGYHVLANTKELLPRTIVDDKVIFTFETYPESIPTYLVAFIISDFKSTPAKKFNASYDSTDGLKDFKTWARKEVIDGKQGDISQLVGPLVMEYMYDKLDIGFPYPKVDQVGIPDFSAGAMENWGLVTYRERRLLVNQDITPTATIQATVQVTAHELAHQWFGDLVTLHWWSDIWLNEGFATYWETYATAGIRDEILKTEDWDLDGQFVVNEIHSPAFEEDSLPNARPISSEANTVAEIQSHFDTMSYSKAGSILRMLRCAIGEDIFIAALKSYLNARKFDIATKEDLYRHIEAAILKNKPANSLPSTLTVSTVMKEWIEQSGYPVLLVSQKNSMLSLSQERFLQKESEAAYLKWYVPITYTTSVDPDFDGTLPRAWLLPEGTTQIQLPNGWEWYILNIQQTGYYRVNYEESNWLALIAALKSQNHGGIHSTNRAQLIDDAFSLAKSTAGDYLNYSVALDLSLYMSSESEYVPWVAFTYQLTFLKSKLSASEATATAYKNFKTYVLRLLRSRYEALGLETGSTDPHLHKLQRSMIANWACTLEHDECVKTATSKFDEASVHPDVKSTVYCTTIRNGDSTHWNKLWARFGTTRDNTEQTIILSALGCSKDKTILNDYLMKSLNESSGIRKQDASSVFTAVYNGHPENVATALEFLEQHLNEMATSYAGLNPIGNILTGIAKKLSTAEDKIKMKSIKAKIDINPALEKARDSAVAAMDIIDNNIDWSSKKMPELEEWLRINSGVSIRFNLLLFVFSGLLVIFSLL